MHWTNLARVFFVVCAASPLLAGARSAEGLGEVSLDGAWDFAWTPSSVEETPEPPEPTAYEVKAAVPGAWDDQLEEFEAASWWKDAAFTSTLGPVRYLTGIGWYRRTLQAPASWEGRAVRLTIGWAVGEMHVWVNGAQVGRYDYGVYTPYALDLSRHVRPGQENEIVISVDNTRGFAGGWAFLEVQPESPLFCGCPIMSCGGHGGTRSEW